MGVPARSRFALMIPYSSAARSESHDSSLWDAWFVAS